MSTPPSSVADKYLVRFPDGMHSRLKASAKQNRRSLNQEILSRLLVSESESVAEPEAQAQSYRRTEIVTIRLTPDLHGAAELTAQVTSRTMSGLIQHALRLYIEKNYPAALTPGAKVRLVLDEAPTEGGAA